MDPGRDRCRHARAPVSARPRRRSPGFSIDTRSLEPGEGFVAIRGPNRDGHAFVAAALDQGAACAIVDRTFPPGDEERLVRVGDTLEALNDLGRAARARATDTKVIAVTGSAGKTGTKEALRLALAPSGSVHASAKSFNNHWGVPLSLANMPKDVRFGVFEIGMNHAGEIDLLTRLVRPHIAIVTTVAPVHLGFFRSVEDIADAKAEIFRGLEPGGTAIINRDNPHYERLKDRALEHGAKIVGFGETQGAEARLHRRRARSRRLGRHRRHSRARPSAIVSARPAGIWCRIRSPCWPRRSSPAPILRLPRARSRACTLKRPRRAHADRRREGGSLAIIDESYNANPASMRAALATLGLTPRSAFSRRVAVLGDMLELGPEGAKLHQDLAEFIDGAGVDVVFACGELMGGLYEALPASRHGAYAKTAEELGPKLGWRGGAGGRDHGQRLARQPHGPARGGVEAPVRRGSHFGVDWAGRGRTRCSTG